MENFVCNAGEESTRLGGYGAMLQLGILVGTLFDERMNQYYYRFSANPQGGMKWIQQHHHEKKIITNLPEKPSVLEESGFWLGLHISHEERGLIEFQNIAAKKNPPKGGGRAAD